MALLVALQFVVTSLRVGGRLRRLVTGESQMLFTEARFFSGHLNGGPRTHSVESGTDRPG